MRRTFLALGGVVMLLATACGPSSHRTTAAAARPVPGAGAGPSTAADPPSSGSATSDPARSDTAPDPTVDPSTAPDPSTTLDPPPTVPSAPAAAVNPTVVPKTITIDYVDAVLAQLNHIYGDAVRTIVQARRITISTIRYLSAIYNTPLGAKEQIIFAQEAKPSMPNVRAVPGDPITVVLKLIYTSDSCIYAKVQTNSDPLVIRPVAPLADEFMGLERVTPGDGLGLNHTPWIFFFDGVTKIPSDIPNQCATR